MEDIFACGRRSTFDHRLSREAHRGQPPIGEPSHSGTKFVKTVSRNKILDLHCLEFFFIQRRKWSNLVLDVGGSSQYRPAPGYARFAKIRRGKQLLVLQIDCKDLLKSTNYDAFILTSKRMRAVKVVSC